MLDCYFAENLEQQEEMSQEEVCFIRRGEA